MAPDKPKPNVVPIKGAYKRRWLRVIVEAVLIALVIFVIVLVALNLSETSLFSSMKDYGAGVLSGNMDWMRLVYLAALLVVVSLGFVFRQRLRRSEVFRGMAVWGVVAVVLALTFIFWTGPTSYGPIIGTRFTVTDGDTIRILGRSNGTRLVGFNTPETFQPRCQREQDLGMRATARLKELVNNSEMELSEVPCACAPGTHGTDACNFGRSCAVLRVNGRNVGDILISEGLAVRFTCGRTSCPPMRRPWCG